VRPVSVEGLLMLDWIGPQLPWGVTGPLLGELWLPGWVGRRQRQSLSTGPTVPAVIAGRGLIG
jgi:hypothetical protein